MPRSLVNCCQPLKASFLLGLTVVTCGCFHPGMYQSAPYGQPMYAPPQNLNPGYGAPAYGAPGSLQIPESSAPPYVPNGGGSTYDTDPEDPFRKSDDSKFYSPDDRVDPEDRVPYPEDRNIDDDLIRPTTQLIPTDDGGMNTAARPVGYTVESDVAVEPEFGFDGADYKWLQGVLHYDPTTRTFLVEYSLVANDRFGGVLPLRVDPAVVKAQGLRDRHPVEVRGHLEQSEGGDAIYHVEEIRRIATRIAG
ncbi:hypothetical protein [Fuerstiella marisgermanici]|uniref:Uncharacterized protein n=1 Tax=Fuerstiella marisgermanici TaxID=1891926 RepID=A0A1P8WSB3_9PLAN|nr:hypothetical protein [Fuerstiella marisgermanici]APZ96957.1 hypothetical protein Fuma_06633 [Fuerstiella marisgermanici]